MHFFFVLSHEAPSQSQDPKPTQPKNEKRTEGNTKRSKKETQDEISSFSSNFNIV
jgi:hypothetical protein